MKGGNAHENEAEPRVDGIDRHHQDYTDDVPLARRHVVVFQMKIDQPKSERTRNEACYSRDHK